MPDKSGHKPAEGSRQTLRRVLLSRYDALRAKLTQRLGSAELAGDALQDTWLRLERGPQIGPVRDPFAYLIRIASNLASNSRTLGQRRARLLDTYGEFSEVDETPDPERVAAARSEWDAVRRIIDGLSERRRAIFFAAWVEEASYEDIAARHGISVRTVQAELKRALEECAAELQKK